MSIPGRLITLSQAAEILQVSKTTIKNRVEEKRIPLYTSERDKRQKLVDKTTIEQLAEPKPLDESTSGRSRPGTDNRPKGG